jgi:putative ABC transport system permease protein
VCAVRCCSAGQDSDSGSATATAHCRSRLLCAAFAGAVSSLPIRGEQALLALRESSRNQSAGVARTRLRSVLLSLEAGLTVVLLIGAGLLLKS